MDEDVCIKHGSAADMNAGHDLGLSIERAASLWDDGPDPDAIEATTEFGHELIELEMGAAQAAEEEVMEPKRM